MKIKIIGTILVVAGLVGIGWLSRGSGVIHVPGPWRPAGSTQPGPQISFGPEYDKNLKDLLNIVAKQDPRVALQELATRMTTNPVVFEYCHILAHSIGRAAYLKYHDFDTALGYQDTTCSDGYLHGVIEGKFSGIASASEVITQILTICQNSHPGDRCWHGVGHGLMFYTNDNLPKALTLCNTYTLARAQGRCYEGVFMQNFLSDPDSHPSAYVDPQKPFTPCPAQDARHKGVCYFYSPIYYLSLHNNDYAAALHWCQTAEAGYVGACTKGVGSLAMKYHIADPAYVEALCQTVPSAQIGMCVEGMMSYYLTFTGSFPQTASMCNQLSASDAATCNGALAREANRFGSTVSVVPLSTVGQVTRHAQGFVGDSVRVAAYLLAQHDGYAIVSDENGGAIGLYDLPVSGPGVSTLVLGHQYILSGVFIAGGLVASNQNPNHLELSKAPQLVK